MTNTQVWLAVGLPTLAVLLGMLVNALVFESLSARMSSLEARMAALTSGADTLFDRLSALH